jgi:nucleoside-diphosphate-sugar epimerase
MRVFVTGATGVIGRRVVPLLATAGHEVTCAVRSREQRTAVEKLGARPVEVDLLDRPGLTGALVGQGAFINLATHMPRSLTRMLLPGAWRQNDHIRRDAVPVMVAAARDANVGRFVQESFAPIYADAGDGWITEDARVQPGRYNRTILDAERAVHQFTEAGGVGIVLRFAAFYGPDSGLLSQMVAFVRRGWAPLPGAAQSFVSSVSHDDAATAVAAALSLPAGIYNVADDEPLRHRDFVDAIARAAGAAPPRMLPAWLAKIGGSLTGTLARSLRISNMKLRQLGAWAPRYPSARDGLPPAIAALA